MMPTTLDTEQKIFDRSETISGLLYEQEGLSLALLRRLSNIQLSSDEEQILFALIDAQNRCRSLAMEEAARIAKSF